MTKVYGIFDNDMDGYGNNIIVNLMGVENRITNLEHPEKVYEAMLEMKDELLKHKREHNVFLFINDLALGSNPKVFDILDELKDIKIVINDHHEPSNNLIEYYKKKFPTTSLGLTNPKDRLVSLTDKIEYGVNINVQKGSPKLTSATEIFYNFATTYGLLKIFETSVLDKLKDIVNLIMLFDTFRCMTEDYTSPYFKTDPLTFNKISDLIDKELWIGKLIKFITTKTITNDTDTDMNLVDLAKEAMKIDQIEYKKCYDSMVEIKFDGYTAGLTFYSKRAGILGDYIRNKIKEENKDHIDLIMVANYPSFGIYSVKENINLSEVARKHGGGGHPKAAGFPTKDYKEFVEILSGER